VVASPEAAAAAAAAVAADSADRDLSRRAIW
jgi:hypothetical protein